MVYRAYEFVYQSFLVVFNRWRSDACSEWSAALAMPIVLMLMFIVLLDALDLSPEIENLLEGAEAILSLTMGLTMLNYFLFIRNDKYRKLLVEYEGKSISYRRGSLWLGLLLCVGGCVFPLLYLLSSVWVFA